MFAFVILDILDDIDTLSDESFDFLIDLYAGLCKRWRIRNPSKTLEDRVDHWFL